MAKDGCRVCRGPIFRDGYCYHCYGGNAKAWLTGDPAARKQPVATRVIMQELEELIREITEEVPSTKIDVEPEPKPAEPAVIDPKRCCVATCNERRGPRDFCNAHIHFAWLAHDLEIDPNEPFVGCRSEHCKGPHYTLGYCESHLRTLMRGYRTRNR